MSSLRRAVQLHKLIGQSSRIYAVAMSSQTPEYIGIVHKSELPYVVGHDQKNQKFHIKLRNAGNN